MFSFLKSAVLSSGGGRFYWARNQTTVKVRGIVAIFAWISIRESDLKNYVDLYSSLGWTSLVCIADFLNPFFPGRATSLAFAVLDELAEELRTSPCPVVLAAFSGGSKACMYKVFQVIEGACEVQLSLDDTRLIRNCISGHIYDSSPIDFTSDMGTRFTVPPTILRMPGAAKLVSSVAKVVTSGLDALFLTKVGSHHTEYWQTLYSSVSLGGPFLILCSENDDLAPYPAIYNFAQRLQVLGGSVELVKWTRSQHVGHFEHYPSQYRAAVTKLLEQALAVYSKKGQRLGERNYMERTRDQISEVICDLQKAAVESNRSFRRVASDPNDHFFSPSSADSGSSGESGSLQDEHKEQSVHSSNPPSMSAHSVLGQILFDACVPKNIEGWDIIFSGKYSPLSAKKCIRRSRL
ncbi:Lovastatin diketide synthase [Actinidia chinensis var. chinensis]|uniref:Lovastatin diketide synthase n=1 Tax=Actinidia chinensis var. chinensis TaxID=1590841 RepID=A0A2R6RC10_ACTCC|nr:Lovastatin diketide synthase [Actinidia chinensis var. chinensis]